MNQKGGVLSTSIITFQRFYEKNSEGPQFRGELAKARKITNPMRIQAHSNFLGQDVYQGFVKLCVSLCTLRGSLGSKGFQKLVGGAILIICDEDGCWIPSSLGKFGFSQEASALHCLP